MKTIADKFQNYLRTVYPASHKSMSTSQIFQLKMAFYGGFVECFAVCRDSAKIDNMEEAVQSLQGMVDETLAFADEVEAMADRVRAQAGSN